jgi:hypothetical protein
VYKLSVTAGAETLILSQGDFRKMLANRITLAVRGLACTAILCVATMSASAHPFPEVHLGDAQVPAATAPIETVTGTIKELVIDNRVTGQTTRQVALLLDDGRKLALNGQGLDALTQNQRVQANGQLSGDALFLSAYHVVAGDVILAKVADEVEGTLAMVHTDNFDQGRSSYSYIVRGDDGRATPLQLAVMPDSLQIGMRVIAAGRTASGLISRRSELRALRAQIAEWEKKDPILKLESSLLRQKVVSEDAVKKLAARITREVDEGLAIAENDPFPDPAETLEGVYADQNVEAPLTFANSFFSQER